MPWPPRAGQTPDVAIGSTASPGGARPIGGVDTQAVGRHAGATDGTAGRDRRRRRPRCRRARMASALTSLPMTKKRPGLGRGLDALLARHTRDRPAGADTTGAPPATAARQGDAAAPDESLHHLPIDAIARNPWQPRRQIDDAALEDLVASIRVHGVVQPIAVRKTPAERRDTAGAPYELIAGERRWRAAQRAGLKTVPAVIHDVDDRDAAAVALIENIQREDLNPLEEAEALKRLIDEFELTHQAVADAIGRSRAAVSNLLRLTQLAPRVQAMLRDRVIEMGHARALLALPAPAQTALADQIARQGWTVRKTEAAVRRMLAEGQPHAAPTTREPAPGLPNADLRDLERRLSSRLGAALTIRSGARGRGKIVIEYRSLDELDGLIERLGG